MEFSYSHKVELPPAELAKLHIISLEAQRRDLFAGVFATASACGNDVIRDYELDRCFYQRVNLDGCSVFWGWRPPAPNGASQQTPGAP
jgi:hypothetical protein